jgi:diguanylate cyclase (GGDEF)-like protein
MSTDIATFKNDSKIVNFAGHGHAQMSESTTALLQNALEMIQRAETIIGSQEERIRHLETLVTMDELTGLRNRRGFYEAFTAELGRCERGISSGGLLVLVDLDNFHAVNDIYGHMAGDACLRLVARMLANEIRAMDAAARLGGDEFVLLLSNTTKELAVSRAQDLAWQLNHLSLAWYGDEIPVQASLGLRSYKAGDAANVIFNEADIELYTSKLKRSQAAKREVVAF